MVLTKENLLSEISKAMDSNPDMYIGDLLEYVVERTHSTRKNEKAYYLHNTIDKFPITNIVLHESLVKYNKSRAQGM
jgi:hypothetical protein